jgi:diacylglycerol kinase family enzyme
VSGRPYIGLVVNPRARFHRSRPTAAGKLARLLEGHGVIEESREVGDLPRIAERFQRRGVDILALSGGDGTNSQTLTGFRQVYGDELPRLAPLRGGTMNTVANSVGIPRQRPDGLLQRLIGRILHGDSLAVTSLGTMDINGTLGFLTGIGAVYEFLAAYYGTDPFGTSWTATKVLARVIASTAVGGPLMRRIQGPFQARVTVDGVTTWREERYFSVTAGTVEHIGLGFKPYYRARTARDHFHLLGLFGTAADYSLQLPRLYRGLPLPARITNDTLAREAVIEVPGDTLHHMIDGDLHSSPGPLRIKMGPRVQVIV